MAIHGTPRREITPVRPMKAAAALFSFAKASSSFSIPHQSPLSRVPRITDGSPTVTISRSMMEDNIENAETMITKWDPNASTITKFTSLFQENRREGKEFIRCVKDLRKSMSFLVHEHSTSDKLVTAQKLMQMAMKRLEKEFYSILSTNREHLDPESVSSRSSRLSRSRSSYSDYDDDEDFISQSDDEICVAGESISEVERLAVLAVSDLRSIADCMISSGYSKECVKIYKIIRKSIVDEALYRLGIEQFTSSANIKRTKPEEFEHKIKNWLDAIKIAVKTLFHGERFLCDHVFSASVTTRETCFTDIAKEGALSLFKFPEIIAKSKRSPEKIFRLLELYETISDLWPEIESTFSYESVAPVKVQALSSLHKLGDSVQAILSDFESSIQSNSSKSLIPGGGTHPLTTSTMKYLSTLANYSGVLSDVVGESLPPAQSPFPESYFDSPPNGNDNPASAVSVRFAWIILVLLCKLDSKAKHYNDVALSYLFLANNLQSVVDGVRTTTLKYLLGDEWLVKHERKVKLFAANYEAMVWAKVLSCLPENHDSAISPEMVKQSFRQFNQAVEEACRKQVSWVVPDVKLRDEIRISIARKLVPAYQEFYDKNLAAVKEERNLQVLVRFSPDNLRSILSELFDGASASGRSWSSSILNPSSFTSSSSSSRGSRCLP